MKAKFKRNCSTVKEYKNKKGGREVEFVIEKIVSLKKDYFSPLCFHLLNDNDLITKNKESMFIDKNGIWHVVAFCCVSRPYQLLVQCCGNNYAKYVLVIENER